MNNESLGTVKISEIKEALNHLQKDVEEISFEYLIGSFFPNAYNNMRSLLKDAYTQGFIEGSKQSKT